MNILWHLINQLPHDVLVASAIDGLVGRDFEVINIEWLTAFIFNADQLDQLLLDRIQLQLRVAQNVGLFHYLQSLVSDSILGCYFDYV